jgi:ADP-ribose pyrophosphatase
MPTDEGHLRERGLTQESVFRGNVLKVRVDTVALPNGEIATREIAEHPGAVAVIPLTNDGRIVLVKQYRYPIDAITLELPAGKLDVPGESLLEAAERELAEETGCFAGQLNYLGHFHTSPGFTNEVLHLFVARNFKQKEHCTEPDEFIEVVTMPLEEALQRLRNGEITDAKTIIGLLWIDRFGPDTSKPLPPVVPIEHH